MNKNIIIKGLAAVTILTSLGLGSTLTEANHSVAKAEKNVIEIHDATVSPYNAAVAFNHGTGFVVGKNTIVTNKHVVIGKGKGVGTRVALHPAGFNNSAGNYDVLEVIPYPGKEDLAVVHVKETAEETWNFNERAGVLKLADHANVNDRISIIGYPKPDKHAYNLLQSFGKVLSVKGNSILFDAYPEPGNSGSPIVNEQGEAVGVLYAGDIKDSPERKGYGVYFTPEIKKFIQANIQK
ncbi:trypsin-like serine protease [Staphylococcus schleiferi subsp. coagulans]|uniref:trypsin-like serine peptidase n=1 Tax=Staphylococcus coagulans TaxID=74706 RepID=UPI0015FC3FA0|nr:serine protease [Staphylococcus coagulans]MBA8759886.1 trypsin-like serine protease [Staphylococcus coagulans]MBA8768675.1 trypsin-like serine protease [Staphylococcus coagulans]